MLFLILYSNISALKHGMGEYIIALPVLCVFLCLTYGLIQLVMGRSMKKVCHSLSGQATPTFLAKE